MTPSLDQPPAPIPFHLPARQPHSGIPLANGILGALLWTGNDSGRGDSLCITLGRQDYWLRVSPVRWRPEATYGAVCEYLRDLRFGEGAGVPEYFEPLTRKLAEWMPQMREYARLYVGIPDGLLLPTAVNDRCEIVGTGWNNQFDPSSGAWTALMLWDHYRYTGDRDLLRTVTYPMLRGHLRVYEEMLRQCPDRPALFLASGPSPEYHRPGRPGWGKDSSYQLAFIHALVRAASEAVAALGLDEPRLPGWKALSETLPTGCFEEGRLFLWRGQDLDESHRHPAHLAGIWPCALRDTSRENPDADAYPAAAVRNSLYHWVRRGQGEWAGWSLVAASQIWTHHGDSDAALGMLETITTMQLDGGIGFVAVVLEILARPQAAPKAWQDVAFAGLKMPGGSTLSGHRERGEWVRLESTHG